MKQRDDLDQMLSAWLDDPYTPPAPRYLGEVLERTRRTRQRPAWTSLERWLPMADKISRPALAPPLRIALLMLIVLLVVALAVGAAVVGSRLLNTTRPLDETTALYPIPQGGAAVLVFDSGDPAGARPAGDIYTVRADGTDLRQLTSGPDIESSPVFSPDGTRIAYRVVQGGRYSLAVMDGGGGGRKTLFTAGQPNQECLGSTLAWSPDGRSLIFPVSAACGSDYVLFIVPSDGSSPAIRLLAAATFGDSAAWSPMGTAIAFDGREGTGNMGLYIADVGGSGALKGGLPARRISSQSGLDSISVWTAPRWSPDGAEVAAAGGTNSDCTAPSSGTLDAYILKADGSGQRTLAATPAKEYTPTWSPDGRRAFLRIVDPAQYVNGRPCTMATWLVGAGSADQASRIGAKLGSDESQPPLWSPDGTLLVGNTVRVVAGVEHYDLFIVPVDSRTIPDVTVQDVGIATWQPRAAPLPLAPSFPAVSPSP
jgi:dipeptidyl aminopeptidase/acylaminoacyl peptidase